MFWEGVPEGPATLRSASGTIEDFQYNQGIREGSATRRLHTGEILEFTYVDGEANGPAKLTRPDGGHEVFEFCHGIKEGLSEETLADGSKEDRCYTKGVLEGQAILYGCNGDKLEFSYRNGKKFGAMTYTFHDNSVERSFYDENGIQNGPTQLVWSNGAKREGHKVNGKWEGQVFYLYAEGPRKGKRDVETWKNGEMVTSQKYYGDGDNIVINDWEDLRKLEDLKTADIKGGPDHEKDVYFDCISTD